MPAGQYKNAAPSGSAQRGKECDIKKLPLIYSGPSGPRLRHAIVTVRPRRHRWLGEANPRSRDRGIERGAGLPAGAKMLTPTTAI